MSEREHPRCGGVFALCVLLLSACAEPGLPREWEFTILEDHQNGPSSPAIAVDGDRTPHISFYRLGTADLAYAVPSSGTWTLQALDTADAVGSNSSIFASDNGNVYISYYSLTGSERRFRMKGSVGGFSGSTLDTGGADDVGRYSSIRTDAAGKIHIAYYNSTDVDLMYVSNVTGAWVIETAYGSGDVGAYPDLDFDSAGKPYVAFLQDGADVTCAIATNASGTWTVPIVVDSDVILGCEFEIADSGVFHVCHVVDDGGAHVIRHYLCSDIDSNVQPEDWTTEDLAVDPTGSIDSLDMALDGNGKVHIVYVKAIAGFGGRIYYLTNVGDAWTEEELDIPFSASRPDLAVADDGTLHMAFCGQDESIMLCYGRK